MARPRKPARDPLLLKLEERVMELLERDGTDKAKPALDPVEMLKAIDAGARLLHIRHRIEDKGSQDGGFFSTGRS